MAAKNDGVGRVDRGKHGRILHGVGNAQQPEHCEPDQHDRAEQPADFCGATALNQEQPDEDRQRDRYDEGFENRRCDLDAFNRAEHRDGRRDHPIAIQQRRAEHTHQHEPAPAKRHLPPYRCGQRREREDPALTVIVCLQDEDEYLMVMTMMSDQKMSDNTPSTFAGVAPWRAAHESIRAMHTAAMCRYRHRQCRVQPAPKAEAIAHALLTCALDFSRGTWRVLFTYRD